MVKIKGYYFITDEGLSRSGSISDVKAAVRCGVKVIQYRNKTAQTGQMYTEALKLKKLCKNTLFIINDRIDIALAVDADGVHIGQEDLSLSAARGLLGKNKIVGVTVSSVAQAKKALDQGANYIAVAPVFETGTKKDAGAPVGIPLIKKIRRITGVSLAAIGGINLENAPRVIDAGADLVCSISCVVTKENVEREILKFQGIFSH